MKLHQIVAFAFLLGIAGTSFGIDDTSENREAQVKRYFAVVPPSEMMGEMADAMSMNFPPSERAGFRKLLTEHFDIEALTSAMSDAMAKHFTADELAALADFYGSPVGKSAMKKMGVYMADVMPVIQSEVMRAVGLAEKEKADSNRRLPDINE